MDGVRKTPQVTFIEQSAPIDEYGRAIYAVARSVLRALIDSLSSEDLTDLNTPIDDVCMRQLAKVSRLERDKGMREDEFGWAVHEAIMGLEPRVIDPVHQALKRASQFVRDVAPMSVMFGYERAKYLGFLDAVIDEAGTNAFLLPESSGRPFKSGPCVSRAAQGQQAEIFLPSRIKQIWKTDLFCRLRTTQGTLRRQLIPRSADTDPWYNAPNWLHIRQLAPRVISPKPKFERLD